MVEMNIAVCLLIFMTSMRSAFASPAGNTGKMTNMFQKLKNQSYQTNALKHTDDETFEDNGDSTVDLETAVYNELHDQGEHSEQLQAGKSTSSDVNTNQRLRKRFLFVNLKLTLNVAMEGGAKRRYEVTLPAPNILGVLEAFIEAATVLSETYPGSQNPFNLSLRYKGDTSCIRVVQAFGVDIDSSHVWIIDVLNYSGKSVYRGTCIPDRQKVRVGPFHEVALTYTHINDTQN